MYTRYASVFAIALFAFINIAHAGTLKNTTISMYWEDGPTEMDAYDAIEETAEILAERFKAYQGDLFFELKDISQGSESDLGLFELSYDNSANLSEALPSLIQKGELGFFPVKSMERDFANISPTKGERYFTDDFGDIYVTDATKAVKGRIVLFTETSKDDYSDNMIVRLTLTPNASAAISKLTANHIGEHIVVAIDDSLQSTPIIQDQISSQEMMITGLDADAETFAILLNDGPLPLEVGILE